MCRRFGFDDGAASAGIRVPHERATTEVMSNAPGIRELTRRLIARATERNNDPNSAPAAVHAACERAYIELTRWVGPTGSRELLRRSLAQAQLEHGLLKGIRVGELSEPGLNGVAEVIESEGPSPVASALEDVLETLLGLLGRLIGNELAARIVENAPHQSGENEGET